ncbi:SLBB domain-containing protein [Agaribacterium haliotis]|uniref:SLBB domain-containing protein n=1 Tax=Agaribacterium haliotis TaxID=2013869 RepID=UPI001EFC7F69|nr:SLBB domain-containing protein [Agaribacterium haliotis]
MRFALCRAVVGFVTLLAFSSFSQAFTPTAAQIQQFKNLPPAEQKALAAAMGVDMDDVNSFIDGNVKSGGSQRPMVAPVSGPRSASNPTGAPGVEAETMNPAYDPMGLGLTGQEGTDYLEHEEELQPFGYKLFDYGADTFSPAEDIPIPAEYVLGPGDTLFVQLYGKESSKHELLITRDGTIDFPRIGPVPFAGLTFAQASAKIEEVVAEQMIGINASVSMGPLRSIRVFILGDVNIPGSYVVGSLSTMTNALFSSGGISEYGSLRNIQLKRGGKLITTLDLYDLLLRGDTSKDSRLLPGDVIFVPPVGRRAGIDGAVKRPAIYELASERSAADLLKLAGGLRAEAYLADSKIQRQSDDGETTLSKVDLSAKQASRFKLKDGDLLLVGENLNELNNVVEVSGHLKRETSYAWQKGLRFSDIIPNSDAFLALPDLDIALIEREIPGSREIEVHAFSPNKAFAQKRSAQDPELKARDKLYFFGFIDDRTEQLAELLERVKLQANIEQRELTVIVNGSVRFPGEYPLAVNMSARQLTLLAGGFTASAIDRDAEITRYVLNEQDERMVVHLETDLETDNPVLEAGDILRIQQIPLWKDKETVELVGEFRHPGTYAILPGETVNDVIRRAGGLTPHAYVEGTVFSRLELRQLEAKRLESLKQQVAADLAAASLEASKASADIDSEEANQIMENLNSTKPLGRLVIDLPGILTYPDELDFQLVGGDIIEIPRFKPSVTVLGEVQFPTSHFYNDRLDVDDYLNRSGGFKRNADKKRVYVVKANGRVILPEGNGWFGGRSVGLSPGDTIIVPLDTRRVDKISVWASVTQIMYQAAIGIAAIGAL